MKMKSYVSELVVSLAAVAGIAASGQAVAQDASSSGLSDGSAVLGREIAQFGVPHDMQ
jgi:hypothetical protein